MLRLSIERVQKGQNGEISSANVIRKELSFLKLGDGQVLLTLYRDPDSDSGEPCIIPRFQTTLNSFYFNLLRAWVRDCDKEHECQLSLLTGGTAPKRLIRIVSLDQVQLYLSESTEKIEYIALSHRWGTSLQEHKTTTTNYDRRLKGFAMEELPRNFQDAIRITKELGKQYLWIDSICIIQEGSSKDFETEAMRMEDYYSNAWCTLAASAAKDPSQGFLARYSRNNYIVSRDQSGHQTCISNDTCDLENEIENAVLNHRGWVLQERALSRRTIHFGAEHTWWECGSAIHCENMLSAL